MHRLLGCQPNLNQTKLLGALPVAESSHIKNMRSAKAPKDGLNWEYGVHGLLCVLSLHPAIPVDAWCQ